METEKNKILVIGIDQCRQSVVENLESENFEIRFSTNFELFSELNGELYDLILMLDFENQTEAIKTCKLVKSNPQTNKTPLIFLSFNSNKRLIIEAFDAGADDFVAYPVDWFELKDKIDLRIYMGKKHHLNTGTYRENQKKLQLVTYDIMNIKHEIYKHYTNHETKQRNSQA